MEKKTIVKLVIAAALAVAAFVYACGFGRGGDMTYQLPGPYTAEDTNDFSTVKVAMTIQGETITDCEITSSGDSDLLNDEIRAEWAESIVANQSAENDVISGATLTYSAASVKAAAADIFAQAGLPVPEPAETEAPADEVEPAEAETDETEQAAEPADEGAGLADGTYTAESTNDFSTVTVEATVEGGKITAATVSSSGDNDLLTDELRTQWGEAIVEAQSADADAITGATLAFSAASVKEAVDDILAQASAWEAAEPTAEGAGLADGTYTAESTNDFSTVTVEATVEGGKITAATVSSSGDNDLLTDELRAQWGEAIVEAQSADADAITGATLAFSAASVKEAVDDILAQAGAGEAAEPADEGAGLADGTYTAESTNDFSIVTVEATVEGGKITAATVSSSGDNDLLTDELRTQWGEAIVEAQSADADAITGATLAFSAASVKEAVDDILAQASAGEAADESDERIAELEAALAEAEARADEAEAKVAELEAAAAVATVAEVAETESAEAESGDISDYTRPKPALEAEVAETEPAEAESGDISGYTRPKPAIEAEAEEAESAEAESGDISGYTRPKPAVETEADEAEPAEAESGDISGYTRPKPAVETEADEAEEAEPAEAESGDISGYTRPKPALEAEAEEAEPAEAESGDISSYTRPKPAPETEEAEVAETAMTEEQRLASILPDIVTTMGDNRENSYVISYLEQDPYLVNIYEGYGFAKDYGSARGHEYTLEDVSNTARPHPKANCITCKTPDLHKMIEEQGVAVYSMPFDEVMAQMTQNVSCYTCHGDDMGNGGQLKVTHQYVNEALGENVATINPATLSCGQCHIEYYFTPEDSETMMPYHSVEEMTPQAILDYYDNLGFSDWTQESTGTAMLKAQHPEMETVLQGKHAAFLSCADCHMPTQTNADGVEYRSHMLVSPLENEALLASCAQCHGDTDMVAFVHDIQDRVTARETEVGNKLSDMKDALAAAVASGDWSEDDLNAVRKLHREAQWFFDYCYVENSEGAHNSELAMSCLDTAEDKIEAAMSLLDLAAT